jgi:hypothetical protein
VNDKLKPIGLALAALLMSVSFAANAVVININTAPNSSDNGLYDVTFVDGTFNALSTTLMDQVWWGDANLAGLFATTLGTSSGNSGSGLVGPDFAYAILDSTSHRQMACQQFSVLNINCGAAGQLTNFTDSRTRLFTFALAERVSEPGIVALLGLGLLGMGFSVRRRNT